MVPAANSHRVSPSTTASGLSQPPPIFTTRAADNPLEKGPLVSGVGRPPANTFRFAPRRRLPPGTQRELGLALGFLAAIRLLIALAALAVITVLTHTVTGRVLAVAGAAAIVTALLQIDRVLERARRDLAETRRATRWAEARAEQRGAAPAYELLAGFRLFDRWGGWLTSPGRKAARERSLALLAATFDRGEGPTTRSALQRQSVSIGPRT